MKKLFGRPKNIKASFIGKITKRPVLFKKDYVFIADNKIENGYAALLSKNDINNTSSSIVCNVANLDQLNDGDIVLIEPTGMINILYETKSDHNVLVITERCNCSCVMCPQPKVASERDRTQFNLKLISLMSKNTKCLGLSGGEPTLLGNKLIDIIMACKKHLPKTALTLLTNGMKLDDFEYAKKIVSINHPDLIIDIPLYGATDTEHNEIIGAKGFYRTIKGLYNLALLRQKVGIRIVMHRLNYNRLPQLAEFIYRNFPFVFHTAFMQMETTGLAEKNIEQLWIDPHDYNDQLKKAVDFLFNRNMNVSIYNAQLCVIPRSLWKFARRSISAWKNIYLEPCSQCFHKEKCAGFFETSMGRHSEYVSTLKE